jgi:Putative prokaryotic signal transducing protein
MQDAKLVEVQACGNRLEAELVKGALEASGIPAMIQADSVGGMREHLAWSGEGFKILVREEDAADAHTLLDASGDAPGTDSDGRPPWRRFT